MALTNAQAREQLLREQSQLAQFGGVKGTAEFTRGGGLTGTLQGEKPGPAINPPAPVAPVAPLPVGPRTLPSTPQGSSAAFSSVMRNISRLAAETTIKPLDVLERYKTAGVDVSTPQAFSQALDIEKGQRLPFIEDTFKSAVELITKQEQQRADYQKQLMEVLPKEALFLMLQRGQIGDLQQLSDAKTPNSLIQALKDIPKETIKPPTISEQLSAAEKGYIIKDGKVIKITPQGGGASTLGKGGLNIDWQETLKDKTPQQQQNFAKLSDLDKSNVMQLINGDALLSDLVTFRGIQGTRERQKLLQSAQSVDPTFSENTNKIRYEFNKKWNSTETSVGKNRTSINTAIGHLADVAAAAKQLNPNTLGKLNSVKNVLTKNFGDPAVTNLRLGINALAGELASVYKNGTAPTDQETEAWKQAIAENFSQSQFEGVFNMATQLLSSKITGVRYQYKLTMGKEYPQTVIDPDKRQQLLDAGIDPNVIAKENITGETKTKPPLKSFVKPLIGSFIRP